METDRLDQARGRVLDQMERGNRMVRLGMFGAVSVEGLMLAGSLLLVDWHNGTQVLVFAMFVLSYTIVVLGLLALAGHVTRSTARILAALDAAAP